MSTRNGTDARAPGVTDEGMEGCVRIAFTGEMGSGKDFWCDWVADEYGIEKLAFARRIKRIVDVVFDAIRLPKSKSFRRPAYQLVGNVGRWFPENLWVGFVEHELEDGVSCVLSDLRFPNEAARLRRLGFLIVRVRTAHFERLQRLKQRDGGHAPATESDRTETAIRDVIADIEVRGEARNTDETRAVLRRCVEILGSGYHPAVVPVLLRCDEERRTAVGTLREAA